MSYQSINPFNGELVKTFDGLTDPQLESAIATAATFFEKWRALTFAERAAIVSRAAGIMRERADEFARPVTLEMGKLFTESIGEVMLSADILDYYATHAERFLALERLEPETGEAVIESDPLGVLFGVQPWNFPYYQLARFAAPNLMAGNVVMVKHSGTVPRCAIAFEQLWRDAGAPEGAYTNLLISHDQVLAVIDDPRIRGVALTGGVAAARRVAERAGKNVKKSTMELGGSDVFIVLEDADLEKTLTWAVWAKMNNMGQCCVAAKRLVDSCRTCVNCEEHLEQFCEDGGVFTYNSPDKHSGGTTFGGYSESIVVDEAFVLRVPEGLDPAGTAPLLCAGITTYSPMRYHGVTKGQKVGIVGLGGLGHMGVKLAKALGAHVVVFTTSSDKVEDAMRLGADEVVLSKDEAAMKKHLSSLHFILDTVGAKHDINAYLVLLRRDGNLTQVGIAPEPLAVDVGNLIFGRRNFSGSLIGGLEETQEMLDFCGQHGITSDIELIPIQQVNEAYDRLVKGDVKYRFVIDMASLKRAL